MRGIECDDNVALARLGGGLPLGPNRHLDESYNGRVNILREIEASADIRFVTSLVKVEPVTRSGEGLILEHCMLNRSIELTTSATEVRGKLRVIVPQLALLATCYAAWIGTQHLLEAMRVHSATLTDHTHILLAPVNVWLNEHTRIANVVLALSSFEVDLSGVMMAFFFFRRRESRPILSLFLLLIMRQLCQAAISLPPPSGMIWHYPGFPTLIVTYTTSTDFFFSGHMAMATLLAAELRAQGRRDPETIVAWGILPLQAFVILAMRFHYVTDVVAGFLAALVASAVAARLGSMIDDRLARRNEERR